MSYACLILGESGTGKTASLRNLDPSKVLLIQPTRKPLPFRPVGWNELRHKQAGSIYVSDDPLKIMLAMRKTSKEIIIVDDWQYILANMFMKRRMEKTYDKYTDIGGAGFDIAQLASSLEFEKRVYVLAHTETDSFGKTKIKTLGKLLDDKIVIEGMFAIVLRTLVENGNFYFSTQNSGSDTVKSPMGMFDRRLIENDLAKVDQTICEYYGICPVETETADASAIEPTKSTESTDFAGDEPIQAPLKNPVITNQHGDKF